MKDEICPFCGCNLKVEREVLGQDKLFTGHSCRGSEIVSPEYIANVLKQLFRVKDLTTPELEKQIKGRG